MSDDCEFGSDMCIMMSDDQGSNFIAAIAAIAVEGVQNAVDHCGNDGNFLPYSIIFILFTKLLY